MANRNRVANHAKSFGRHVSAKIVLDFAETPYDSGDIVQIFRPRKGMFVHNIMTRVVTPEGATLTVDIGDYNNLTDMTAVDADGYHDGRNLNATADTVVHSATPVLSEGTPNTVAPAYAFGKGYTADNVIGVLLNNDAANAKVEISIDAVIVD